MHEAVDVAVLVEVEAEDGSSFQVQIHSLYNFHISQIPEFQEDALISMTDGEHR